MERLQGSLSVLGWNDFKGVLLSWDGLAKGKMGDVVEMDMEYPVGIIETSMKMAPHQRAMRSRERRGWEHSGGKA